MSKKNNIYIKKARKKRLIRRIILIMLVIIISGLLFIFKTDTFKIDTIECVGDNLLTKEFVIQKTESFKGENICTVSKSDVEKILKENPYVKSISIKKNMPKSLEIEVTEAAGLYYIAEEGNYSIISKELILLERVQSIEGKKLVELKGINITGKELGSKIDDNTRTEKLLEEIYKEEEIIQENGEEFSITALEVNDLSQIKAYIGNIQVILGSDENVRTKMSNAIKVYKSGLVTEYINVSFNGSPNYK